MQDEEIQYGTFIKIEEAEELEEVKVLSSEYSSTLIETINKINSENKNTTEQDDSFTQLEHSSQEDDLDLESSINQNINVKDTVFASFLPNQKSEQIQDNSRTESFLQSIMPYNWEQHYQHNKKENRKQNKKQTKQLQIEQTQFDIDSIFS